MIWLSFALATPLPEDVSDALDARALALLDGPPGCWELVGKAQWDWQFSRFGARQGDAVFAGRMVDGVWREFHLFPTGETQKRRKETDRHVYVAEDRFRPLIGELAGSRVTEGAVESDAPPVNAIDDVFAELSSNVWTSEVSGADDGSAAVVRRVQIDGGDDALLTARFPDTDSPATAVDLDIPGAFRVKGAPVGARVVPGAKARIRGEVVDGVLLPTGESFRFGVSWMGLSFEGFQRIDYTSVTRCGSSEEPEPL